MRPGRRKTHDPEIDRVEVGLSDVNGPRGGVDKQCRIVARMRSLGTVVVEDADGDFYTVVSRAADRIAHSVAKSLDRRRNGHKSRRRGRPEGLQPGIPPETEES